MTREEAITRLHWLKRELIKGTDMNEPIDMAIEALSAEAVSRESYMNAVGYVEWLEKIIVYNGANEWLCEDTPDTEWCKKNCHYSSIQAECLRHLYEVSKGGDDE